MTTATDDPTVKTDDWIRGCVHGALCVLAARGMVEDDPYREIEARLERIYQETKRADPDYLADMLTAEWQEEYERTLPRWTCPCGEKYVVMPSWRHPWIYALNEDGTFGRLMNVNRHGGQVTGAACSCGRDFERTLATAWPGQIGLF